MKIISNGTTKGTFLYTDSGEEIGNVINFSVYGDKDMPYIIARVKIFKPTTEINLDDTRVEWIIEE